MQAVPLVRPDTLSQAEVDAFAAQGYLPARPILTAEELPALRQEYDRLINETPATELGGAQQQRRMLQIMQAGDRSTLFHRLRFHPRILAVLRELMGPNLLLYHDQILFKPAHDGGAVPWHQDNGYWRCRPALMVSCWLTLDDADEHNGAMQVIPGSHLTPTWHAAAGTGSRLVEAEVDAARAMVVPVPAGHAMFHHCQTLHHTAPNHSDRQRRAFVVHAMLPGTRDPAGKVMRAGYDHPVLAMEM